MTGYIGPKWWEWLLAIPHLIYSFVSEFFEGKHDANQDK